MRKIFILTLCLMPFMTFAQTEFFEKKTFSQDEKTLPYRIMMPESSSENKKYPLVLFLHGAGERGNDNNKQLTHGSKLFAAPENRKAFPCIAVFPQCPKGSYWANPKINRNTKPTKFKFKRGGNPTEAMESLMDLVQKLVQNPNVDASKIYVAGLSMGGMGTFELLSRMPDTFAAAIAICGGGNTKLAEKYSHVPMWIFHGAKDDVVIPQHSVAIVEALLKQGAFPKFTLYDDANHNSWDPAFAEKEFLPWLFSQKKQ